MASQQYRVTLTGELMPGYTREGALAALVEVFETPASNLRGLFDGGEHTVGGVLSAERALDLQNRLERIGVRCRIDKLPEQSVDLRLRGQAAPAATVPPIQSAGQVECPACGHQQLVSNRCDACGIVFAEYLANQAKQATPPPASAQPQARPAPTRPQMNDDWRDFVDDYEPDENADVALFFGENAEAYLNNCKHMRGPRMRFFVSWNWGAVFSPFLWAMYRKMWGLGLVIFITEVFLPVLLITLGSYGVGPSMLEALGYLGLIANRLFWPALANFLYCRHARATLERLHMMSPNYAAEIDIATAGGTSNSSAFVGVACACVMTVFLWSLVDSLDQNGRQVQQQRLVGLQEGGTQLTDAEGRPTTDDLTGLGVDDMASENKWVSTRRKLRTLGQSVNTWLAARPGADAGQLNLFRLREEVGIDPAQMLDGWNGEVQYIPDNEGYRLISAGPDRLFGTADDIQYRRVLTE